MTISKMSLREGVLWKEQTEDSWGITAVRIKILQEDSRQGASDALGVGRALFPQNLQQQVPHLFIWTTDNFHS